MHFQLIGAVMAWHFFIAVKPSLQEVTCRLIYIQIHAFTVQHPLPPPTSVKPLLLRLHMEDTPVRLLTIILLSF